MDFEQHWASGWNAAAIAVNVSKDAAIAIIEQMELTEEDCDEHDWETLSNAFGSEENLRLVIEGK